MPTRPTRLHRGQKGGKTLTGQLARFWLGAQPTVQRAPPNGPGTAGQTDQIQRVIGQNRIDPIHPCFKGVIDFILTQNGPLRLGYARARRQREILASVVRKRICAQALQPVAQAPSRLSGVLPRCGVKLVEAIGDPIEAARSKSLLPLPSQQHPSREMACRLRCNQLPTNSIHEFTDLASRLTRRKRKKRDGLVTSLSDGCHARISFHSAATRRDSSKPMSWGLRGPV